MFEVFSTREVASAIYLTLFLIYALVKIKDYTVFTNLFKAVFKKVLVLPVLCLLAFAGLIVYGLQFFPFWEWVLIKDVIIWVLFVATPICFKSATNKKTSDDPFKKMVLNNFIGSAIIKFFIGAFTFSFWSELFVVPAFTLLILLQNFDRGNEKYVSAHKFLDGISIITGLILFVCTLNKAIDVITQNGVVDVLVSFCIPIIFSIVFLPLVYIIAVKALYHDLFVRIRIRNKDSDEILSAKKKKVFSACGLSYRKIKQFITAYHTEYIGKVCFGNDDDSFMSFVDDFKKGGRKNDE